MKQLVCEMCGSTDLIKSDGVFMCQSCGCKYSVEEAKKMMVEGTVEVQGTVKLDSSEELKNLYEVARRAKDADNAEQAITFYEQILMKDPHSWEANFYTVYFKSWKCKVMDIEYAAKDVTNSIYTTMQLIRDYVKDTNIQNEALIDVVNKSEKIKKMLWTATENDSNGINFHKQSPEDIRRSKLMIARRIEIIKIDQELERGFKELFSGNDAILSKAAVVYWKKRVRAGYEGEIMLNDTLNGYIDAIKKYEPLYNAPKKEVPSSIITPSSETSSSGGCYVATAVYGSYDCPQVWTLRRYRDYTLTKTWYGRAFIRTYYAISPTLVKWFGKTNWFKKLWRGKIDYIVKNLQNKGFESTPYKDKY